MVTAKNAAGCVSTGTEVILAPAPGSPSVPVIASVVQPSCTVATGTINVTTVSGMTYKLDGGTAQASGTFATVASGSHTITAVNASGCESPITTVLINVAPSAPTAPVVASSTNPTCTLLGTITVTAVSGMEYSLNGGAYQTSGAFTSVAAGTYMVTAKNAAGCVSTGTEVILAPAPGSPSVPVIASVVQPSCTVATGTINVTTVSGMTYKLDGGTAQASGTFATVASGSHTITAVNASGCESPITTVLINVAPSAPTAPVVASSTNPTCTLLGTITVTAVSGMEYSLNGGAYQTSGAFTSVAAGTYMVTAKNAAGCVSTGTEVILAPAPGSPSAPVIASVVQPSCTVATGTINVTTVSGMTYKLDGGTAQASGTFATVASGSHTITAVNASGCESPITTVLINVAPSAPTAPVVASSTNPTCTLLGTITVTAVSGMEYSLNGGAYQTSGAFTSVAAGTYMVTAKNAAGCVSTGTEVILAPAPGSPSAPVIASVVQPSCTVATGTINVTTVSGMTYKLDGGTAQASGTFATVASGSHTITAVNASGCESPITTVLINVAPSAPTAPVVASSTNPTCTLLGTITVTAVSGMEYSLNGGAYQTSGAFTSVAAGTYMVTAKNAAGCVSTGTEVILAPAPGSPSAPVIASVVQPSCTVATGTINVTTVSGMTYKLDGGTAQASGTFATVASGSHTITAVNASGCESPITTVLINVAPSAPTAPVVASSTNPTCTLLGTITVTAVSGMEYSLNGGAYQTSGAFTSVAAGTYMVTAKNAAGCVSTGTEVILAPAPGSPSAPVIASVVQPSCTVATGTINVTTVSGMTYKLDGGTAQASGTFATVASGSHTITAVNASGCESPITTVLINVAPSAPTAPVVASSTNPTCTLLGTITVTAVSGMEYSLNGGAYQTSGAFTSVAAGTYMVTAKNAAGCVSTGTEVILAPAPGSPSAPVIASVVQPSCTVATGTINVTTVSGMTYKLDGGTAQASGTFATVASGSHTITAVNASGCESPITTVLINVAPSAPTAPVVASSTNPTCTLLGTITVTAVSGMEYSLNGGAYQTSGAFTSVAAGTYMVTAKNAAGCVSTGTEVILAPAPGSPSAPVIASVAANCTASGTSSINNFVVTNTYTFSPTGPTVGAGGLISGMVLATDYTVTANNGSCSSAPSAIFSNVKLDSLNLLISNPPVSSSVDITSVSLRTGSILPVSTVITYHTDAAGTIPLSNPNAVTIPGSYYIKATTLGGCVQIKPIIVVVVSSPCPNEIVLRNPADNINGAETKKAAVLINASNKINSSSIVNYQAGGSVTLNPGFETSSGAVFKAEIKGCND